LFALRWALPVSEEEPPPRSVKLQRNLVTVGAMFVFLIWLNVFAILSIHVGRAIAPHLGVFAFLGNFVAIMGEILELTLPAIAALFGIGLFMALGSRLGYFLQGHLSKSTIQLVNLPLAGLAAGIIGYMIGRGIDWLYEITVIDIIPGLSAGTFGIAGFIVGVLTGIYLAVRKRQSDAVKIGLIIYYIARTIFNTLRSIEPLVMVIVFVVWVGFGPFAGMLALSLHTAAALAKLYSEQVESIQVGPLEAVRATGATRLQTVVYAVVPQIVPPYISFTMYRWDINVRMSTIIGFAGGGGIGFLLQQNIQLLQYRAAAAQMLAIAIVVATMDYVSSRLRERMV
jgi:phosphonate ABC transporter permease subunit PhnE